MVDSVTKVDDFHGGIQYQYNALEYTIPPLCDILIHSDKSITLYKKGELEMTKKTSMSCSTSEGSLSNEVEKLSIQASSTDEDATNSDSSGLSYIKVKNQWSPVKIFVFEAKRGAFRESRNARLTAMEKGTAVGANLNNPAWLGCFGKI